MKIISCGMPKGDDIVVLRGCLVRSPWFCTWGGKIIQRSHYRIRQYGRNSSRSSRCLRSLYLYLFSALSLLCLEAESSGGGNGFRLRHPQRRHLQSRGCQELPRCQELALARNTDCSRRRRRCSDITGATPSNIGFRNRLR